MPDAAGFLTLMEAGLDAVVVMDARGVITHWNRRAEATFGWTAAEAVGRKLAETIIPPDLRAAHSDGLARHLRTGESVILGRRIQVAAMRRDGELFPVELTVTASHIGGEPAYIGSLRDISDQLAAAARLSDSETRLRLASDAAELGVWDWDVVANTMVYSERAKAIFGFPPDQPVTFEQVRDATHPEDYPRTWPMAQRALDPQIRAREPYDYRIVRPDGEVRWVLAHGEALFEAQDGVERAVRYVGTIQDITARKQAESALAASEGRLRLALDAGRMAIWELDVATSGLTASRELNRLLGFPEDYAPTLEETTACYYPGERERIRAIGVAALARGERFFETEYRMVRRDGAHRWGLLRAEIILNPEGRAIKAIGVVMDITDRKSAEIGLVESEQRLRALADNVPNGMIYQVLAEPDGRRRFTYVSNGCAALNGVEAEAVMADASVLYGLVEPEFLPGLAEAERIALETTGPFSMEVRMRPPGGEARWFQLLSAPRPSPTGGTVWDGIQLDIHDRKLAEQALQGALEQRSALFRELSHRVANGFQIMASLLMMQARRLSDPTAVAALESSAARVQSMGLVHRKLYVAGGAVGSQDLSAFLTDLITDLHRAYLKGSTSQVLELKLAPVPSVPTDMAVTLGMIASELVINAAKHGRPATGNGHITVSLRERPGGVELRVADDGPGVPEDFDLLHQKGQGMLIATSQASQLGAALRVERLDPGVAFSLTFRIDRS